LDKPDDFVQDAWRCDWTGGLGVEHGKQLAWRAVALQFGVTLILLLVTLANTTAVWLWATIGAAIAMSATGVSVWGTFGSYSAAQPQKLLGRLLITEGLRWGMVLLLLSLVLLKVEDPQPLPLFAALLGVWLIPALLALGIRSG
jgi:F0F1-type ATP synthase assembly protein I